MTRAFSGIQPTGDIHLGNYLGALRQWVAMQDTHDCVYCVVDMHAITTPKGHDAATLRERTIQMATGLLAVGIDPQRSILFVQSHLGDIHGEATWMLNCVTRYGELNKQPQFKEKSAQGEATAGLFDYPVLQTADIILYDADEVPVGEDQRHHIELARNIAGRFNHTFGEEVFVLPKAVHPEAAARVMDLQYPENRMSTSAGSPKGTVQLFEDAADITKKFRSAVTDSGTDVAFDRKSKAGISNLLEIFSVASGRSVADLVDEYADGGYGTFKADAAEAVVEMLRPMQERHAELSADPAEVTRILSDGAQRARAVSAPKVAAMKKAVGFLPA